MKIRKIEPADDKIIAKIVRSALEEFDANKTGTVYFDNTLDNMYDYFKNKSKSAYWIAEDNNIIFGGSGIFPSPNLDGDVCELVRMYLSPSARGKRIGQMLLDKCLEEAQNFGYKKIYLETMPELDLAIKFYEKNGFQYIASPLGNTGHKGCQIWMLKDL